MGCVSSKSSGHSRLTDEELAEEEQVSKSIGKRLQFESDLSEFSVIGQYQRKKRAMVFGFENSGRNTLAFMLESLMITLRLEKARKRRGRLEEKKTDDNDEDDDEDDEMKLLNMDEENDSVQKLMREEQYLLQQRMRLVLALIRQRCCQLLWTALQNVIIKHNHDDPDLLNLDLFAVTSWVFENNNNDDGGAAEVLKKANMDQMEYFIQCAQKANDNNNSELISLWMDDCDYSKMHPVLYALLKKHQILNELYQICVFDYHCPVGYRFFQRFFVDDSSEYAALSGIAGSNSSSSFSSSTMMITMNVDALKVFRPRFIDEMDHCESLKSFDEHWLIDSGINIPLNYTHCAHCVLTSPLLRNGGSVCLDFFNAPITNHIPDPKSTDSIWPRYVYAKREGGFVMLNDEHFRDYTVYSEAHKFSYPKPANIDSHLFYNDPWVVHEEEKEEGFDEKSGEDDEQESKKDEEKEEEPGAGVDESVNKKTMQLRLKRVRFWPKSMDRLLPFDSATMFVFDLGSIAQWMTIDKNDDGIGTNEMNGFVANLMAYQQWMTANPRRRSNRLGNIHPSRHVWLTYSRKELWHLCKDMHCDLFCFFEMSRRPSESRIWKPLEWYQSWMMHERWMEQYCHCSNLNNPKPLKWLMDRLVLYDEYSMDHTKTARIVLEYWLRKELIECDDDVVEGSKSMMMIELISEMCDIRKSDHPIKNLDKQMDDLIESLTSVTEWILMKTAAVYCRNSWKPHIHSLNLDNLHSCFKTRTEWFLRKMYSNEGMIRNHRHIYRVPPPGVFEEMYKHD